MKRYINIFIALIVGFGLMSACESDIEKVVISESPVAPVLQAPGSSTAMEFIKDDADKSITYEWSESDFGFQAAITYILEMSLTESFETSSVLLQTQNLSGAVAIADINAILLSWDVPIGESTPVKIRVSASVSSELVPSFSEISDFTSTPYETLIDYPLIYVPGGYQGWSPGAVNGRLYSYEFNSVYSGIIRISETENNNGEFKIAPAPNWDLSYGGTLTASGKTYSGKLDTGGGNMTVAPATYEFTVDMDAFTIGLEKTDDWGIIGSSVPPYNWSTDVDMDYDGQRQIWSITSDFVSGVFKFRANDDWGLNYGSNDADGNLQGGGSDIPIEADGNYTIQLNLQNLKYSIEQN